MKTKPMQQWQSRKVNSARKATIEVCNIKRQWSNKLLNNDFILWFSSEWKRAHWNKRWISFVSSVGLHWIAECINQGQWKLFGNNWDWNICPAAIMHGIGTIDRSFRPERIRVSLFRRNNRKTIHERPKIRCGFFVFAAQTNFDGDETR